MRQLELLQKIVGELEIRQIDYVLCGGIAASLYRDKPRFTNDVDIAVFHNSYEESKEVAMELIEAVGAKASLGWIPKLKERNINTMALVIGQFNADNYDTTVDIILPNLPWVKSAISNGKNHVVDYGFAKIPVISAEDLIIAKIFALNIEPNRFQDLDDLKSIFSSTFSSTACLDLSYIRGSLDILDIAMPEPLEEFWSALLR